MLSDYEQATRERAYRIWEEEGRPRDRDIDHWLRAEAEILRVCSYCCGKKHVSEFSYEHIWPDGVGGDNLPPPWQTYNVCERCNNLSGLFVDGEFIRSWFGSNERAAGGLEFVDPAAPEKSRLPLNYMGPITHLELQNDEVAEFWIGPCGAHVIHIRPKHEPLWDTYAGGKPSRKRLDWGSAYLTLTSTERFWIVASVFAFHNHFRRAERFVTNMPAPQGFSPPFSVIDPQDADQARKVRIAGSIGDTASRGEKVRVRVAVKTDIGSRLLTKLALGLGRELLGESFLTTSYAVTLRRALWERDPNERRKLPVRGSGYLSGLAKAPGLELLWWPNAWTLTVWHMSEGLVLIVGTPTGQMMTVLISAEPQLLSGLKGRFAQGEVFITVPVLGYALDHSIALPYLLAHQTKLAVIPDLTALGAKRRDPGLLPSCR
jgi:hypothetical protein